jgi:hypothetical protein
MYPDACESFGFLSTDQNCESPSFKRVLIEIQEGSVSLFGDIAESGGLRCLLCEEREYAKCEDFGENDAGNCPDGFIPSKRVHEIGDISNNGKYCFSKLNCYSCEPPFRYRVSPPFIFPY